MKMRSLTILALSLSAVCGCSGATEPDALADSGESVDSVSEALNTTSCIASNVTPNKVLNNVWGLGEVSTPNSSYGQPGCDAYLVEVRNYLDHPDIQHWNYANDADSVPNQEQCARIKVRIYFWTKVGNNPFTYFKSAARWGTWNGSACVTYINLKDIGDALPSGATVRYAMKSQLHTVAGDSNSSFTRREVFVQEDETFGALPLPPR